MAKEWPPEMLALPPRKCKKCGETKVITDFPRNRTSPGGVFETCMECYKASRGKNGSASSDTRFTSKDQAVRATPTRRQPEPEVVLPANLPEPILIGNLNSLPKSRFAVECTSYTIKGVIIAITKAGRTVDEIYKFVNSRGWVKFFIYSKPLAKTEVDALEISNDDHSSGRPGKDGKDSHNKAYHRPARVKRS